MRYVCHRQPNRHRLLVCACIWFFFCIKHAPLQWSNTTCSNYTCYWFSFVCSGCSEQPQTLHSLFNFKQYTNTMRGQGSSVGIATELRAGRSGIESRWGRDFPPVQTCAGAHPASCKMGTVSFPGVKCGRGVLLTAHPLLVPRSWETRAIPLPYSTLIYYRAIPSGPQRACNGITLPLPLQQ